MSKKVVGGIEISDDTPVSEYDGKFSGSFELDVEQAASLAYDDEVQFVVTGRLDSYSFKPTKYGDLKRTNVFKVDHVGLLNENISKVIAEIPVVDYTQQGFEPEEEVYRPSVESPPGFAGDVVDYADPSVGRSYNDPLLQRFFGGLMADKNTGIVINQIGFGDDFVEINYFETREQSDDIGIMRTIVVKTRDIEDARAEILAGIEEVIDYALVALRNPPKQKFGPGRLRDRVGADLGEDE